MKNVHLVYILYDKLVAESAEYNADHRSIYAGIYVLSGPRYANKMSISSHFREKRGIVIPLNFSMNFSQRQVEEPVSRPVSGRVELLSKRSEITFAISSPATDLGLQF